MVVVFVSSHCPVPCQLRQISLRPCTTIDIWFAIRRPTRPRLETHDAQTCRPRWHNVFSHCLLGRRATWARQDSPRPPRSGRATRTATPTHARLLSKAEPSAPRKAAPTLRLMFLFLLLLLLFLLLLLLLLLLHRLWRYTLCRFVLLSCFCFLFAFSLYSYFVIYDGKRWVFYVYIILIRVWASLRAWAWQPNTHTYTHAHNFNKNS